jgi:hypothetical protein
MALCAGGWTFPINLQTALFKKSKFESPSEKIIHSEILVEWVAKLVETRY